MKNVHQRLAEAMGAVSYVQKNKPQGMRYSIVSHDAVTAKVRPALLAAGIVYYPTDMHHSQNGNRTEVRLSVRFVNIDEPTDFIEVPALGYGVDDQDKGPGKAVSYAVKYALLKALGLETGDDADLEAVEHKTEPYEAVAAREAERLRGTVEVIRDSIAEFTATGEASALSPGSEAWAELTNDEKRALWVAPTKMQAAGFEPVFTTAERQVMQTPEFRTAHREEP